MLNFIQEPIGWLTELSQTSHQKFVLIILIEGRRDNFGYLRKNQEKLGKPPATRSPINLDGIFHYSFEINAFVIDKQNTGKIISKEKFCQSKTGQKIFNGVRKGRNQTELDAVLQLLEIKLSRTDSGKF